MTKVAIVKDSDLLRGKIIHTLQEEIPAYDLVVYDSSGYDSLYTSNLDLDVIIIDMNANIDYYNLIDFYLQKDVKIAVWGYEDKSEELIQLFKLGLHGYLYNEMETRELIFSIRVIMDGSQYIDPHLAPILLNDYLKIANKKPDRPEGVLTDREWQVLELIVKGEKNCTIGDQLYISYKTVTNHVASIFRKLHVSDRTSAALLAVKKKWIIL